MNKQVKQSALVKFIEQALEKYEGLLVETLPDSLLTRHQLIPRAEQLDKFIFRRAWNLIMQRENV